MGELYRTILNRVKLALDGFTAQGLVMVKWCFNKTMHHRAIASRAHIMDTLGWEILPHLPYFPDIAPSDYHLFRSMKNHLRDVRFQNDAQLENWVANFLEVKSATFYQRGIQKLPRKWQKVIDNNGHYIISWLFLLFGYSKLFHLRAKGSLFMWQPIRTITHFVKEKHLTTKRKLLV